MADRLSPSVQPSGMSDPFARPLFHPHGNMSPPRMGDVPPALSPLDAFAMQGRLLAKKFEEENTAGKRISRLPAMTIASEFARARPEYFRSMTDYPLRTDDASGMSWQRDDVTPRSATEIQTAPRPRSHYPQIQSDNGSLAFPKGAPFHHSLDQVEEVEHQDYFMPRSHSPEFIDQTPVPNSRTSGAYPQPRYPTTIISSPEHSEPIVITTGPSMLAPPNGMGHLLLSPTIRAIRVDSADDMSTLSLANSVDSLVLERPQPQFQSQLPRSPSLASDRSASSTAPPINSFNYSRPISRASRPSLESKRPLDGAASCMLPATGNSSRPSLDIPFRQDSGDAPLTPFSNDAPQTPVSLASEEMFLLSDQQNDSSAPTSFIYAKYSLSRPNTANKRESVGLEEFMSRQFRWSDGKASPDVVLEFQPPIVAPQTPPSPAMTTSPPSSRRKQRPTDIFIPSASGSSGSTNTPPRRKLQKYRPTTPSTMVLSSATARSLQERSVPTSSTDLTPETHLDLAIDLHESGSFQESTYHFRLAANAGNATAMLLYALACRHGWGMKPNAAEGVAWLQKAVDSTQMEVADDEDHIKQGQQPDVVESKAHKAQFALGVYELGVSYMRGWGLQQDKALALRCFEVAGNWGDADALAEAGLCYTDGIGCKRDLKKAAKFYRLAEARGMSLAGNSWIHKDKYMESDDETGRAGRSRAKSTAESRKRSKSRTKAFFNRKKNGQ